MGPPVLGALCIGTPVNWRPEYAPPVVGALCWGHGYGYGYGYSYEIIICRNNNFITITITITLPRQCSGPPTTGAPYRGGTNTWGPQSPEYAPLWWGPYIGGMVTVLVMVIVMKLLFAEIIIL